jgi:hypothetical protein
MRAKLARSRRSCASVCNQPIPEQGRWLGQVVKVTSAITRFHEPRDDRAFHRYVARFWYRTLRRRSQKDRFTLGTGASPRCRLAPSTSKLPPLATRAFRRQTLEVRTDARIGLVRVSWVVPCKCVQLSRLRWWPRQRLASSRVPSLTCGRNAAADARRQEL